MIYINFSDAKKTLKVAPLQKEKYIWQPRIKPYGNQSVQFLRSYIRLCICQILFLKWEIGSTSFVAKLLYMCMRIFGYYER